MQLPEADETTDAHNEDDEMIYEKTEGKWAFDPKTGLIYFKWKKTAIAKIFDAFSSIFAFKNDSYPH